MNDVNKSRSTVLFKSSLISYIAIFSDMLTNLITVSIMLTTLGATKYGIWLIISSIANYFQVSDAGIGLSLMNQIARTNDVNIQRSYIKKSLKVLSMMTLGLVICVVLSYSYSSWFYKLLGNIPNDLVLESYSSLLIVTILFLVRLPTTLFTCILSGLQNIVIAKLYTLISNIVAFAALLLTLLVSTNLFHIGLAIGITRILVGIACGVHLFVLYPQLRPWNSDTSKDSYESSLINNGLLFLFMQIATMIVLNSDNIIIGHYLSPVQVTQYGVAFKIFYMGILLINSVSNVLWPMYAKAVVEQNWHWIGQVYNWSVMIATVMGGALWIGGIIFAEPIIDLWLGKGIYGGSLLVFALGGYAYFMVFMGYNMNLMNALNPTKYLLAIVCLDAVFHIAFSIFFIDFLGITGVAIGAFISTMIMYSWFAPYYIRTKTDGLVKLNQREIWRHFFAIVIPFVTVVFFIGVQIDNKFIKMLLGMITLVIYFYLSWRWLPAELCELVTLQLAKYMKFKR